MNLYVMIGFQTDYDQACFAKYSKENNFKFFYNTANMKFIEALQKLHCCESVNRYINLPLKAIWFNLFGNSIECTSEICFIFSKSQSWLLAYKQGKYINLLRNKYPKCKIVLYLRDLINSYYKFDVKFFKDKCDAVLSYDNGDASKYGLLFCNSPYSIMDIYTRLDFSECDIYFCGKAKNRLDELYKLYEYFVNKAKKCKFIITGVPKEKVRKDLDIQYNKKISYYENLQYIQSTKCILDVVQQNSMGETLRVKEAITYGKKLITNNQNVEKRPFYSKDRIYIYNKIEEIDMDFLQGVCEPLDYEFSNFEEILEKIMSGMEN